MMAPKNEKSIFQHRGYLCSSCDFVTQVYGRDPTPGQCTNCGAIATLTIKWNHVVTSTKTFIETDATWDNPEVPPTPVVEVPVAPTP